MSNYQYHRLQLISYINENRLPEAERYVMSFISEEQNNAECLYFASQILARQYRYKEGLAYIRQAVKLLSAPELLFFLAETLYKIGEVDEAKSNLDVLMQNFPNEPKYIELKGKIIGRSESTVGCRLELVDIIDSNKGIKPSSGERNYKRVYSARGEQDFIAEFFKDISPDKKVLVDIGAGDGFTFSNSLSLLESRLWNGLLIEANPKAAVAIPDVMRSLEALYQLAITYVTPERICSLLDGFNVPKEFGFLSLDIDSYEYPVLNALLTQFRPNLICVEINERIPPGIEYYPLYDPNAQVTFAPLFMGVSISSACNLLHSHRYVPIALEYNNLFATTEEIFSTSPGYQSARRKSDRELFQEGFLDRPDSFSIYPWNEPFRAGLTLPRPEFIELWKRQIISVNLEGKCILEIC
jgi:hypothetical protein